MKEYGSVKVTLSSWGPDRKGATHMTNATALPIQVATDETVSMAHYNAAMDAKDARIDALEAALRASEVDAEKWRKFATTAASYFKQDIDATLPEVE